MSGYFWLPARIWTAVTFLSLIILSIPLAFDVGGRDCGLLYSLCLTIFYFLFSTARMAMPTGKRWKFARFVLSVVEVLQYVIVIPGLLIFALNEFSEDEEGGNSAVEEVLKKGRSVFDSTYGVTEREGWERVTIGPWDTFLTFSTPMFQLAEGFCSLLVIQTLGQISKWLVNRRSSDTWMISLLIMSGSIISTAVYFLWRITTFPHIETIDATLIGVSVTCAVFLCAYGIGSGRGNPIESSLLFSYIVLCIYQIFTDYKPTHPLASMPLEKAEFPPLPPMILDSYTAIVDGLAAFLPEFLREIGTFVISAYSTLTPSVIISLAYRLFVFYAATRIIPAVQEAGRAINREPSLQDKEPSSKIAGVFNWYSPCILVAVYTHLLLQHFEVIGGDSGLSAAWTMGVPVGGHVWRWVNAGATMALYAMELAVADPDGSPLTSHWKTD